MNERQIEIEKIAKILWETDGPHIIAWESIHQYMKRQYIQKATLLVNNNIRSADGFEIEWIDSIPSGQRHIKPKEYKEQNDTPSGMDNKILDYKENDNED